MSWKKVLSIVAVGALLGVPLQTLGDNDRNGRNTHDRDNRGHDRDRHDRDHQQSERERQAKKAERAAQFRSQLIARFSPLAGAGEYATPNATSLVDGVHNGTTVTLKSKIVEVPPPPPPPPGSCGRFACPPPPDPVPVEREVELTFDVPTGAMKYKQVAIALALMEAKLKDLYPGIVTATGVQIQDVLAGGSGILTMRAKKKNWIQIVRSLDLFAHTTQVSAKDDDDDDD